MARPEGLTVAETAAVTGVSGHTLRYYEKAGLIRAVTRNGGNQRRYRPGDVEWVRFLLRLRETGMPIARMREYAALRAEGDASLPARMELLVEHHDRLREQIAVLRGHERALRAKVAAYARMLADAEPDEESGEQR
ncbi:MAG: MerR family transcriptional regulator [Microbacteriaceae bacterium]